MIIFIAISVFIFCIHLNYNLNYLEIIVSYTVMLFKFIQTNESLVVTRFGQLHRVRGPGIRFYIPFIEETYRISNRLYVHSSSMNVRTSDKVFPKLDISIQYRIKHEDSAKAMF